MGAVLGKVLGDGKTPVSAVNGAIAPRVNAVPAVGQFPVALNTRKNNARNNIAVPVAGTVAEERVNVVVGQAGGKRKSKAQKKSRKSRKNKKRQTKRRR